MFLLRDSELEALQVKDVTFGEHARIRYVRIFIRKSKTDQEEFGVVRSLKETKKLLCPYRRLKSRFEQTNLEGRESQGFGDGILGMVTRLVKWSVAEHNIPSGSFSIHSLRSGGATCLYHSGVDIEYIYTPIRTVENKYLLDLPPLRRQSVEETAFVSHGK